MTTMMTNKDDTTQSDDDEAGEIETITGLENDPALSGKYTIDLPVAIRVSKQQRKNQKIMIGSTCKAF